MATTAIFPDNEKHGESNIKHITPPSQLNLWHDLTMDSNIFDTKTEEIYQTVLTASTTANNIVQINTDLQGWVNKRSMIVGIPIQFGTFAQTGAQVYADNSAPTMADFIQPELVTLSPIVRFEIRIGKNNQIIQRNEMNYAQHLRLICLDQSFNWGERIALAHLGLPYSQGFSDISLWSGTYPVTANGALWDRGDLSFEVFNRYNQYKVLLRDGNTGGNGSFGNTYVSELGLPLFCVNSFFADDAYLPINTPIKIEIEFMPVILPMCISSPNPITYPLVAGTNTNVPANNVVFALQYNPPNGTSFVLRYRSSILKEHVQKDIFNKWITRPFLYQYETYQPVEIIGDGQTMTFTKDITISQERPTSIYFRIMNQTSLPITLGTYTASGDNAVVNFPNATAPGWTISNLFVYIGGRQTVYMRHANNQPSMVPNVSANVLNDLTNAQINFETNKWPMQTSRNSGRHTSNLLQISLNPGDLQKRGFKADDQGAFTIRCVFNVQSNYAGTQTLPMNYTGTALPSTHKIIIYKKYSEQIELDAQYNITSIQWPAVPSKGGYLIANTINMN